MRLFDTDEPIGCYLDDIGHRIEKTNGGEIKMVDLTLRVQPFTPEQAAALDPDVRSLLFSLSDATQRPKIKRVHFNLSVPRQTMEIRPVPDIDARRLFSDVEITDVRARTQANVDGFALVFYATFEPAGAADLEYVCNWLTQQRFITFEPLQPALAFDGAEEPETPPPPRKRRRGEPAIVTGEPLRPGVHAEH
jgi:hypothetical protein